MYWGCWLKISTTLNPRKKCQKSSFIPDRGWSMIHRFEAGQKWLQVFKTTSCQIFFEFLFIKTCPADKLHNRFGFVIQFCVGSVMKSVRAGGHHLPALIYSFSGEKKINKFYFRTKHRTRKNSSVSYIINASNDDRHDGCHSLGMYYSCSPF